MLILDISLVWTNLLSLTVEYQYLLNYFNSSIAGHIHILLVNSAWYFWDVPNPSDVLLTFMNNRVFLLANCIFVLSPVEFYQSYSDKLNSCMVPESAVFSVIYCAGQQKPKIQNFATVLHKPGMIVALKIYRHLFRCPCTLLGYLSVFFACPGVFLELFQWLAYYLSVWSHLTVILYWSLT